MPERKIHRRSFLETVVFGGAGLAITGCRTTTTTSTAKQRSQPRMLSNESTPRQAVNLPPGSIVDTHIHVVHGNPDLKPIPEEMERLTASPPEVKGRRLRMDMEQAKVAIAFAMGHREGRGDDPLGIESSLEVAAFVPGLKVIGIADPRRVSREHLLAVERQIERQRDKIVAFKAYLGYLHFGPEDPLYVPYIKLAAKYNLPVIFHTGDTWSYKAKQKFAHPLRVDEVATDHPEVQFVIAHLGKPWLIDAAQVVWKNNNVWADLSGLYVGDEKSIGELLKQERLPDVIPGLVISDLKNALSYAGRYDRIVYGSDWPLAPMAVYRRFFEAVIPKGHYDAVFRTNAVQLFGLKT